MSELIDDEVKAVFFDWDDTLVGTIENKWRQHIHVAREFYGRDIDEKELREHWGKPLSELIKALYETEDVEEAIRRTHLVHQDFPKILFDHTLGVVERIRGSGRPVGLVTAHRREGLQYDFDQLGVPSALFDYIQTEDDTPYHKPDPRVFEPTLIWLARNAIAPGEAVYVGDSFTDRDAAVGAGMQFIGVETGLVTAETFQRSGAVAIRSLVELLPQ